MRYKKLRTIMIVNAMVGFESRANKGQSKKKKLRNLN
jgi:hypothetical protein